MRNRVPAMCLILGVFFAVGCNDVGSDARAMRERGMAHMNAGRIDVAIAHFDSAIKIKPNDADSYNSRGNAYALKRDHDRAIADFDSAIALRPTSPLAYKNRGVSYSAKFAFERALKDFDQSIKLMPNFAGALNSRGFARQMTGDYMGALQDYDRAIQLAPESQVAYRNRANVLIILGRFKDAAKDLERSISRVAASTPAPARFNESGAYAVVWLHVAKMRDGQNDSAQFAAMSARVDSVSWPRPVISFFENRITSDQLVAQTSLVADAKLRSDQRCGAEFFAGQAAIWKRQLPEARKRLTTMTSTCSKSFVEYAVATADLARLEPAAK